MSLEALLGEWAGLEPERCKRPQWPKRTDGVAEELPILVLDPGFPQWVLPTYNERPVPALQVAVQEAIESKGLYWCLERDEDGYYAGLRQLSYGALPEYHSGAHDSPAEALLTVHLLALRAAKETR